MRVLSVLILGLFLVGCDLSSALELVYYKRAKYSFENEEQASKVTFMCEKSDDKNKTKQRATSANDFYVKETHRITEELTADITKNIGDESANKQIINKLTEQAEKLVNTVENNFQCMLIDLVDLDEEEKDK